MKPQVIAWELGKRLAENAIVSCDSGTIATWFARQIPAKRGQMHSLSGNLATMAPGLPYSIAAQIAYPDRQCVAFVGDGGFSMLMAEFATCVKYKLPIKVFIVKNNTLGQIKWEQMVFLGNPEYGCELQPIDFALFAQACGGVGFFVDGSSARKCTVGARQQAMAGKSRRASASRNSPPVESPRKGASVVAGMVSTSWSMGWLYDEHEPRRIGRSPDGSGNGAPPAGLTPRSWRARPTRGSSRRAQRHPASTRRS